jgi:serine/threonine protein kinase
MKVLNKKAIIERNELEHTKTEKKILQKLVHPFLVNLYYSFQTDEQVVFVMDYVNGGELFFHLQKDRRFPEERVRFYVAEIILGLEYLHANGVLYRDLKPENLLLNAEGHICMTDFGISKEGFQSDNDRTATFCGTPEYLAPEILEGSTYGKPVDWWSLGTLMYEMLNGLPPFYSQDIQAMYSKIMTAKLTFPDYFSTESCDFLSKLLERNPEKRLSDPKYIKQHPFFSSIDWEALSRKEITPPYVPPVKGEDDISMIDEMFTSEPVAISPTEGGPMTGVNQNDFDGFAFIADK